MLVEEENRKHGEQLLLERPSPAAAPHSPTEAIEGDRSPTAEDVVRARKPAPQPNPQARPSDESRVVEVSEPRDDQRPEQHDESGGNVRDSFLRRHSFAVAAGLLLSVPAVAAGYLYWDNAQHFQSTDDAFIATRQFAVAPQVSGSITAVPVTDNEHVTAGAVIARIDQRTYRAALDQVQAQLARDQAVLAQAQRNLARYQFLARTNSIAQQQVDDQGYLVEQDKATVELDQANVETAQINLSNTVVTAAQAGRVVSLSAALGQFAQTGTSLTMFVPDQIWVTANFKETQLDAMRPGQPVQLTIDAYPERVIHGHIASVQSGSGTAFSLLPPENATGNWVKVVQRVPVKIIMDDPPADVALGPGMSVDTSVRVHADPSLYERLRARL